MENDFFVVGFYHVPEDVAAVEVVLVAFAITEPFIAIFCLALYNTPWLMYPTICTCVSWKLRKIIRRLNYSIHRFLSC